MMRALIAISLAAAVSTAGFAARAADTAYAEAKQRMVEGKALYDQGKFEEARVKYAQACGVLRTDNCLRSLAAASLRAGKALDAYKAFKELTSRPDAMSALAPQIRDQVTAMAKEAYEKTAHLAIVGPANARVSVDGKDVGLTPLATEVDLESGRHVVELDGGATRKMEVDAASGKVTSVKFQEEKSPATQPAAPATASSAPAPSAAAASAPPRLDSRTSNARPNVGPIVVDDSAHHRRGSRRDRRRRRGRGDRLARAVERRRERRRKSPLGHPSGGVLQREPTVVV
jgi:hypothetical protein